MAKMYYAVEGDRDHVYEAANVWKETCLINDGTILFDNEAVWTIENLQLLKMRFTDNPQPISKAWTNDYA